MVSRIIWDEFFPCSMGRGSFSGFHTAKLFQNFSIFNDDSWSMEWFFFSTPLNAPNTMQLLHEWHLIRPVFACFLILNYSVGPKTGNRESKEGGSTPSSSFLRSPCTSTLRNALWNAISSAKQPLITHAISYAISSAKQYTRWRKPGNKW